MIFCSVVMVSSNRLRRTLRNPDQLRAPPSLLIRRADQDTICQIKFLANAAKAATLTCDSPSGFFATIAALIASLSA